MLLSDNVLGTRVPITVGPRTSGGELITMGNFLSNAFWGRVQSTVPIDYVSDCLLVSVSSPFLKRVGIQKT